MAGDAFIEAVTKAVTAAVVGENDALVLAFPAGMEPRRIRQAYDLATIKLGHERILVVSGAETITIIHGSGATQTVALSG